MKKVTIQRMYLHYFKGIKSKEVVFGEGETTIAGPNGCGKSTIADAFTWLLWGKNQLGESDSKFLVKTVDESGTEIPHVNHEVNADICVDGSIFTLRRVLVPEYNKNDELKGNHTEYFWNEVPMKKSEYDAKVKEIVDETVFKLITSPYAFLTLDWKKQRDTLMTIAGGISDIDVAGDNEEYKKLLHDLETQHITLEEHRRVIVNKIARINEKMIEIPARIDESRRNMPVMPDLKALEEERNQAEQRIAEIDKAQTDVVAAHEEMTRKRLEAIKELKALNADREFRLNELQAAERNRIHAENLQYDKMLAEVNGYEAEMAKIVNAKNAAVYEVGAEIDKAKSSQNRLEKQLTELRNKWHEVNSREFKASDTLTCPVFGHACRDCDANRRYNIDQQSAFDSFCNKKDQELAAITKSGFEMKQQLEDVGTELASLSSKLEAANASNPKFEDYEKKIAEARQWLSEHPRKPLISTVRWEDVPEHEALDAKIAEAEKRVDSLEVKFESSEYDDEKRMLQKVIYNVATQMAVVGQIGIAENRIKELEEQLREMGISKMMLEAEKQVADDFEIAKMNEVSRRVNGMFRVVSWQMYQRQVNGENVPACIAMVNGVRWTDANTAARINAGIDVAATLARANDVSAPMFIDNAECSGYIYDPGDMQRILLTFDRNRTEMNVL